MNPACSGNESCPFFDVVTLDVQLQVVGTNHFLLFRAPFQTDMPVEGAFSLSSTSLMG
jgi:hypothetical protein